MAWSKEKRREYAREYLENLDPEMTKKYRKEYYQKNRDKILLLRSSGYNKEKRRQYNKARIDQRRIEYLNKKEMEHQKAKEIRCEIESGEVVSLTCIVCKTSKPLNCFTKSYRYMTGYAKTCRDCNKITGPEKINKLVHLKRYKNIDGTCKYCGVKLKDFETTCCTTGTCTVPYKTRVNNRMSGTCSCIKCKQITYLRWRNRKNPGTNACGCFDKKQIKKEYSAVGFRQCMWCEDWFCVTTRRKNQSCCSNKCRKESNAILSEGRRRIRRALVPRKSIGKINELFGCTPYQLRIHLESQFIGGMNWHNRGFRGWHVDHRVPCSAFDLMDITEQRRCFHYTNLSPLWSYDNMIKNDKWSEKTKYLSDATLL